MTFSVPQGPVLGPLLVILYTADLAYLASKLGVKLHAFADDNQLHVLQQCVVVIERTGTVCHCDRPLTTANGCQPNRLKLIADREDRADPDVGRCDTDTRYNVASFLRLHDRTLTLGSSTVKAADVVRVFGVLFTPDLAFEKHVTRVSAKCFFQLCRVRRSLDRETAATLVHALRVTSRIDNGNALLVNAPRTTTDKLQRVLNATARVITGTRKFDRGFRHISTTNCTDGCICSATVRDGVYCLHGLAWHRSTSLSFVCQSLVAANSALQAKDLYFTR